MLSDPPAPARSLATLDASAVPLAPGRPVAIPVGWTAAASRLLTALFLLVVLEALYTVPKNMWDLTVGSHEAVGILLGLGFAAAAAWLLWTVRYRLAAAARRVGERLAAIPVRLWLLLVIGIGIALRVAWVMLFPAPFASDGLAYYDLAARLAHGLSYRTPFNEWAEWPPGYPFILFVHFRLLGVGPWAVDVANLLLFAGSILAVYALARRFGEATARLATLLLALWPNLIASAGAATKEMVIIFLLPVLLLLYLRANEETSPGRAAAMRLVAGMVLGFNTLTQPGILLLAVAFAAYELLLRTPPLRAAARLALLGAGMLLVILPWTWRNYRVLHTPVLITSCGGDVFYRANNPLANGGWIQNGERPLKQYDELTRSRLGYQWAKEWIRAHPDKFLLLSLKKQVLFLGDDAVGFYETLKRGLGIGGTFYALAKLGSNAFWIGIWALVLAVCLLRWPTDWHRRPEVLLFLLTILYFWAIDSVFESGARHHMPLAGLLAILAASLAEALPARAGRASAPR
ncbi:MAG TPA: glycosyltransferase family 39 protein [Thermoanaerobaculia bacterium]